MPGASYDHMIDDANFGADDHGKANAECLGLRLSSYSSEMLQLHFHIATRAADLL